MHFSFFITVTRTQEPKETSFEMIVRLCFFDDLQ